jgi:hypothetical protein
MLFFYLTLCAFVVVLFLLFDSSGFRLRAGTRDARPASQRLVWTMRMLRATCRVRHATHGLPPARGPDARQVETARLRCACGRGAGNLCRPGQGVGLKRPFVAECRRLPMFADVCRRGLLCTRRCRVGATRAS